VATPPATPARRFDFSPLAGLAPQWQGWRNPAASDGASSLISRRLDAVRDSSFCYHLISSDIKLCYHDPMKTKHARTLSAIYTKPTLGGIVFADIEALVVALGGSIHEGAGSRIAFELNGTRRYLHRPHPGKEAKRYQVEDVRDWFNEMGIKP